MVKLIIGFIVIAAGALYLLSKGGGNLDMGGEKHGIEVHDTAPKPSSAASAPKTP